MPGRLRALSLITFDHVYIFVNCRFEVAIHTRFTKYVRVAILTGELSALLSWILLDAEYCQYSDNTIFAITFSDMNKKWGWRNVSIWLRKGTLFFLTLSCFIYSCWCFLESNINFLWCAVASIYYCRKWLKLYVIVIFMATLIQRNLITASYKTYEELKCRFSSECKIYFWKILKLPALVTYIKE